MLSGACRKSASFAAGAALAGAVFLSACGGGTALSPSTSPTTSVTIAATPSAVAAPAPVASPTLTPSDEAQIRASVKQLIAQGLKETPVSVADINGPNPKVGPFLAGSGLVDTSLAQLSAAVDLCDMTNFGRPFAAVGLDRTVLPTDADYADMFAIQCQIPAEATKALFEASGNTKFKQANAAWMQLHRGVLSAVHLKDPRVAAGPFETLANLYYISQ